MALFRSRRNDATIAALYGAIVAQARAPVFYAQMGVPDTVEGRFDMIVLHLALLVRRARRESEGTRALAQQVFDRFCTDMDHNLREMGVGEMAVPRRMRGFGEAFYGRASVYDAALDRGDAAELDAALVRNLRPAGGQLPELAGYVMAAVRHLDALAAGDIDRGRLDFPLPQEVVS
jgi:cytochrome b pre-mRNA-processing protein 3